MKKLYEYFHYLTRLRLIINPSGYTRRVSKDRNKLGSRFYRFIPVPKGSKPLTKGEIKHLLNLS